MTSERAGDSSVDNRAGALGSEETFDERMARLSLLTDAITAPAGLEARITRALAARGADLVKERRWEAAWRPARRGAVVALVAAVVSVVVAFSDDHHLASAVAHSGEDRIGVGGDP